MVHNSIASVFGDLSAQLSTPEFLVGAITEIAGDIAEDARQKVTGDTGLPNVIAGAISVGTAEYTKSLISIDIMVDLKEAPMAAAFEFGSGIHSESGEEYDIEPREATPELHFWWENESKWFRGQLVTHPGVAANHYLMPAMVKNMDAAKAKIINKLFGVLSATLNTTVVYAS